VPSAVAAAATGLLVHPLAVRLSRGVDRLFYGERADPYAFLSTFSASLRTRLDVPEVPAAVCAAAVSSLRLSSASLHLPTGGRALASAGQPAGTGHRRRAAPRRRAGRRPHRDAPRW
jgi:hypothetical protein